MADDQKNKLLIKKLDRITELLEYLLAINLYCNTSLDQGTVAKRLGIGKPRFNAMLKGIEKEK